MRTPPPRYLANFDSAPVMLRALARCLRGRDVPLLGLPRALEPLVGNVNRLPPRWREKVEALSGASEAISPDRLHRLNAERLSRWAADMQPDRRYPAVAIGSSSGAAIHLCAALGIPWLPQTFLIPVRRAVHPDEPAHAVEAGIGPGRALLEANPEWQLHHMHDPNQDRLMLRYMSYFRVKRRVLGPSYERFLDRTLSPGSTLYVFECRRRWPTTRVGPRHVFQQGALGGATEDEYLHGGERVAAYLARYGSHRRRWVGPTPDGDSPEAEWGFEPALRDDVLRFARRRGHRVVRVVFDEPEHLSPLVADLYRWWYRRRRISAKRLLLESFILLDPWWAMRTGSVPFWMKFNMEASLASAARYLDAREPFDDIRLVLFSHGVNCVGLPPIERWRAEILARARERGDFLGVDPRAFPLDFAVFARYHEALASLPARYPIPGPLSLRELGAFLDEHGDRYPVTWS